VTVEAGEYTWDGLVRSLVERVVADRESGPSSSTRQPPAHGENPA
jgi:hypothetical protein